MCAMRMFNDRRHLPSIPNVERTYRVVVAKAGLDGHDRGVKVIARVLRDAGFEVIYTGLFSTPDQIAEVVLQEDADAVGLSVLSGAHEPLFAQLVSGLQTRGLHDVVVFGGGIIPDDDVQRLKGLGVAGVFTPGSSMDDITAWLADTLDRREAGTGPDPDDG